MSVSCIAFSKNRPAQLDLLIRSLKLNAPGLLKNPAAIICNWSDDSYHQGYLQVARDHPDIRYYRDDDQGSFKETFEQRLLWADRHIALFVDDDVVYRALPIANPGAWLDMFPTTLSFSLRLGLQTTYCYPLRQEQGTPDNERWIGDFITWNWRAQDARTRGDWAYPASVDGGVFRREDLLVMLKDRPYANPNQLEEALVSGALEAEGCIGLAAFTKSCVVGIPSNSVSETHGSNRYGETHGSDPGDLNEQYLAGRRLSLASVDASEVTAAHVEFKLKWEDEVEQPA